MRLKPLLMTQILWWDGVRQLGWATRRSGLTHQLCGEIQCPAKDRGAQPLKKEVEQLLQPGEVPTDKPDSIMGAQKQGASGFP